MKLLSRSPAKAYIGLGANLDDPVQQILDARQRLIDLESSMFSRSSSMYLSSPVGYAEQPNFINCVLELHTASSAHVLFSCMQNIEQALGRVRVAGNQNAPRRIDLDLLIYGDQQIDDEVLNVPHPRIGQRLFVLEPLAELGVEVTIGPQSALAEQTLFKLVC